jgi:hypothetical protein
MDSTLLMAVYFPVIVAGMVLVIMWVMSPQVSSNVEHDEVCQDVPAHS